MITLRKGDRIRLVRMPDDPDPIVPGREGTVECLQWVHGNGAGQGFMQIAVRWDNGRRLMLNIPPDVVELVAASSHEAEKADTHTEDGGTHG